MERKYRYLIEHNKGLINRKYLYADHLEYKEGNALFWLVSDYEKRLIGLFSLKEFYIIDQTEL